MTAHEGKPTLLPQQGPEGGSQRPEPSEEKHFLNGVFLERERAGVIRRLSGMADDPATSLQDKGTLRAAIILLEGGYLAPPNVQPYTEDVMVKALAPQMRRKLAKARAKGRGGWENPERCNIVSLHTLLAEHIYKDNLDMVDVANLAGMVWWRLHTVPGDRQRLMEHLQARALLKSARN